MRSKIKGPTETLWSPRKLYWSPHAEALHAGKRRAHMSITRSRRTPGERNVFGLQGWKSRTRPRFTTSLTARD
ncbi:uncharacterized protein PGTG_03592 [Puccinia graminis f. sp. tritici CRL 75-36-700-3]|uniref:Uncharacterized protein n=1 Tax=Puccinia graminis f. sp. tritici (strain CRL 75-36-700-3 / race SCCL) TaxID=418459 RepID=E3K011_PUCGT|nr:uncharacterized protein PGTG_03592 [Puccinia graminis f. sp. tritici CRL 75-36-700-3]EFP77636.2 hypothetical protein PGTG_03592 [Puccinia graminis f. sp. tritici CRL 75-36-700-3]